MKHFTKTSRFLLSASLALGLAVLAFAVSATGGTVTNYTLGVMWPYLAPHFDYDLNLIKWELVP